jgi:hypothetical protein
MFLILDNGGWICFGFTDWFLLVVNGGVVSLVELLLDEVRKVDGLLLLLLSPTSGVLNNLEYGEILVFLVSPKMV